MHIRAAAAAIGGILAAPFILAIAICLLAANFLAALRQARRETPMASRRDRASVVIPNWNGKELLEECLHSVVAEAQRGGHEVLLVDNGSSDGSVDYVREHFPEVHLLALGSNLGFGAGCNAGVRAATHDIVVLLNNDMRVEPGAIDALLDPFVSEDVFAVSAQILFWDAARRREETGQTVGKFSAGRLYVAHEPPGPAVRPVFYAGGGSSAYDRQKFLALGGFDPLFEPFYGEDTDLSYRAWRRGWSVLFQPRAVVHHKHRGTIGRSFAPHYIVATVERNHLLFIWANASDWRLLLSLALAFPLHALASGINGRPVWRPLFGAVGRLVGVFRHIWREAPLRSVSDGEVTRLANDPLYFKEVRCLPQPFAEGQGLNVLVLSPYFPYPPAHGGAVRIYNLIKYLSGRNHVTLVSFVDTDEERDHVPQMLSYCQEVYVFLRRPRIASDTPFGLTPLGVKEFEDVDFKRRVRELLGSRDYHVLQIDYTQMAQYVEPSRHHVTLLTEHDLAFLSLYRRFLATPWSVGRIVAAVATLKMLHFELHGCRMFDVVLTVTGRERDILQRLLPQTRVSGAVPTGVDADYYRPGNAVSRSPRLLFVGYFGHSPNVDALLLFCREIYPYIKERVPQARLTVAGKLPVARTESTSQLEALAADPSVDLKGFVPDLRPLYHNHAVFVAPITVGAGVRVKILEAMAAGIPVVTTSIGAEGIECEPGLDLLIADDPEEFAGHVVRLLEDQDLAGRMAARARRVVETRYHWEALARSFENVCLEALAKKRKVVYGCAFKAEAASQPDSLASVT